MSDAPSPPARPRLHPSLPFRRIALVLSGGGALGAYEIGVLRVVEALKLVPSLVVGVSIGAINAVAWLAAGRDATPIERVWRTARGETLGVQWVSLALRVTGALTAFVALLEMLLTLAGSRELSGAYWLWRRGSAQADLLSTQLDASFWIVLALMGALSVIYARRIARWLDRRTGEAGPEVARKRLARVTLLAASVHLLVWLMGWPWPHRFSAAIVILLVLAWAASTPGLLGRWLRSLALGLMPETRGRGLWSGRARRGILDRLVAAGDRTRVHGPGTGLVMSALAVDRGLVTHFVSWPEVDREFEQKIEAELGEVVHLKDAVEVVSAAVASSAIPGIFQPERVGGREFVDAGGFSNQPLHVAIAHGEDAMLVVLLSPSTPPDTATPTDVVTLGGRLLELANWRDLQTELRHLPPGWTRAGGPASAHALAAQGPGAAARVCVVEPPKPLPASALQFDPELAGELIALGERDAWAALERAGWLEQASA